MIPSFLRSSLALSLLANSLQAQPVLPRRDVAPQDQAMEMQALPGSLTTFTYRRILIVSANLPTLFLLAGLWATPAIAQESPVPKKSIWDEIYDPAKKNDPAATSPEKPNPRKSEKAVKERSEGEAEDRDRDPRRPSDDPRIYGPGNPSPPVSDRLTVLYAFAAILGAAILAAAGWIFSKLLSGREAMSSHLPSAPGRAVMPQKFPSRALPSPRVAPHLANGPEIEVLRERLLASGKRADELQAAHQYDAVVVRTNQYIFVIPWALLGSNPKNDVVKILRGRGVAFTQGSLSPRRGAQRALDWRNYDAGLRGVTVFFVLYGLLHPSSAEAMSRGAMTASRYSRTAA